MNVTHIPYEINSEGMHIKYDLCVPGIIPTKNFKTENISISDDEKFNEKVSRFFDEYNETLSQIERLTNHADGYDYALAVSSGIIAGLIDAFFVGEWNFATAKAISNEEINRKVQAFAKKNGLEEWVKKKNASAKKNFRDSNRLDVAVEFLEGNFKLPGDNTWKGTAEFVSAKSHHLDDIQHHPTLIGMFFSILSQFTETAYYVNKEGTAFNLPIVVDKSGRFFGKTSVAKIASGFMNWCFDVIKNWQGHLHSDMVGSIRTSGGGMGIPGTLFSTLKEFASLPGFENTDLSMNLYKAYVNGIGTGKSQLDLGQLNVLFDGASSKFDLRSENAIAHELKRQSIPVVINEIIVRCTYFIRHLYLEWKNKGHFEDINWQNVIPLNNRTIARMMTISTGTLEVIDLADAAIRSIATSGVTPAAIPGFVLRINFVGIGRFSLSCANDIMMGINKNNLELALASADVAKASLTSTGTINRVEQMRLFSQEHLNDVSCEVDRVTKLKF